MCFWNKYVFLLVMGRYTENTELISDIWIIDNRYRYQKNWIPTIKYRKVGSVRYFIFISPTGSINLWKKNNTKQNKQNKNLTTPT